MSRLPIACLSALLLSACGPVDEPGVAQDAGAVGEVPDEGAEPAPAEVELCDAADFRPLIGTAIAAAAIPEDREHRAFGDGDIVTQEYLPQRTNIVYDARGRITAVWCG